ncbi:MAG: hypothetical protein OEO83_17715 [Alphaproteobacteria bacterium]|nr:hypothetical protein [Alphaproteobacteria bacterium]
MKLAKSKRALVADVAMFAAAAGAASTAQARSNRLNSTSEMESGSMNKGLKSLLAAAALMVVAFATAGESLAGQPPTSPPPGVPRGMGPQVYVASQGLVYDTIVLGDLPFEGRFQKLEPGVGPTGLQTEFGPGDPEYVGGRWWVDANMSGDMDDEDVYFLCPLLGPGY